MKKITIALFLLFAFSYNIYSQNFAEWRGPNRTGIYNETGLLKVWPKEGPKLLWSLEGLPKGHSSVSKANNTLYFTGIKDTMDVLIAVSLDGKILWETPYGRSWDNSYPDSRATPTILNDSIYLMSGLGDVSCVSAIDGKIHWTIKGAEKFGGTFGRWGVCESLLLVDDKLVYTPGGDSTTMVTLNKTTGETIWMTKSLKDGPSYTSPLLINRKGKKIIVTTTEHYIIGVQPEDGKILWNFDFGIYARGSRKANNQTNTPLYHKGGLFITSGYDHLSVKLDIAKNGESVSLAWKDSTLDVHHGGVVLIDGYIYGANWEHNRMGRWVCMNWKTGEIMYEKEWKNKGSIISAEGMLYCYEEKKGNIALVKATPNDFNVISSFKIPLGTGPHWSHPVIQDGVLYVRHGEALMAYDIKDQTK